QAGRQQARVYVRRFIYHCPVINDLFCKSVHATLVALSKPTKVPLLLETFPTVLMEFNQPDLSILHEDSDTVDVALRFPGLKLPTLMDKLVNFFKERPMPDRLFGNAKFSLWNLKSDQLELELTVRGDDKKETNYRYVIRRFPCEIDVHRARLKAKQSYDKTHCFLIIEFYKSRHGADWKTFMALHGNLDAG
ncbi:hypothetical protein T08_332, partial [Trichinella sp. T8]